MQLRRRSLIQVFGDSIRFKQRVVVADAQHRHFGMRRDFQKPVGAVVAVDVGDVVVDVFGAQHNGGALHPRTRFEAAQHWF